MDELSALNNRRSTDAAGLSVLNSPAIELTAPSRIARPVSGRKKVEEGASALSDIGDLNFASPVQLASLKQPEKQRMVSERLLAAAASGSRLPLPKSLSKSKKKKSTRRSSSGKKKRSLAISNLKADGQPNTAMDGSTVESSVSENTEEMGVAVPEAQRSEENCGMIEKRNGSPVESSGEALDFAAAAAPPHTKQPKVVDPDLPSEVEGGAFQMPDLFEEEQELLTLVEPPPTLLDVPAELPDVEALVDFEVTTTEMPLSDATSTSAPDMRSACVAPSLTPAKDTGISRPPLPPSAKSASQKKGITPGSLLRKERTIDSSLAELSPTNHMLSAKIVKSGTRETATPPAREPRSAQKSSLTFSSRQVHASPLLPEDSQSALTPESNGLSETLSPGSLTPGITKNRRSSRLSRSAEQHGSSSNLSQSSVVLNLDAPVQNTATSPADFVHGIIGPRTPIGRPPSVSPGSAGSVRSTKSAVGSSSSVIRASPGLRKRTSTSQDPGTAGFKSAASSPKGGTPVKLSPGLKSARKTQSAAKSSKQVPSVRPSPGLLLTGPRTCQKSATRRFTRLSAEKEASTTQTPGCSRKTPGRRSAEKTRTSYGTVSTLSNGTNGAGSRVNSVKDALEDVRKSGPSVLISPLNYSLRNASAANYEGSSGNVSPATSKVVGAAIADLLDLSTHEDLDEELQFARNRRTSVWDAAGDSETRRRTSTWSEPDTAANTPATSNPELTVSPALGNLVGSICNFLNKTTSSSDGNERTMIEKDTDLSQAEEELFDMVEAALSKSVEMPETRIPESPRMQGRSEREVPYTPSMAVEEFAEMPSARKSRRSKSATGSPSVSNRLPATAQNETVAGDFTISVCYSPTEENTTVGRLGITYDSLSPSTPASPTPRRSAIKSVRSKKVSISSDAKSTPRGQTPLMPFCPTSAGRTPLHPRIAAIRRASSNRRSSSPREPKTGSFKKQMVAMKRSSVAAVQPLLEAPTPEKEDELVPTSSKKSKRRSSSSSTRASESPAHGEKRTSTVSARTRRYASASHASENTTSTLHTPGSPSEMAVSSLAESFCSSVDVPMTFSTANDSLPLTRRRSSLKTPPGAAENTAFDSTSGSFGKTATPKSVLKRRRSGALSTGAVRKSERRVTWNRKSLTAVKSISPRVQRNRVSSGNTGSYPLLRVPRLDLSDGYESANTSSTVSVTPVRSPGFVGLRELMQTPKDRRSARLAGVKELMGNERNEKASPAVSGVKKVMNTPKSARSPRLGGLKRMVATPKSKNSPRLAGIRRAFQSPRKAASPVGLKHVRSVLRRSSPRDARVTANLKNIMKTPRLSKSPLAANLKEILKTPHPCHHTPRLSGVQALFELAEAELTMLADEEPESPMENLPDRKHVTAVPAKSPRARRGRGKKTLTPKRGEKLKENTISESVARARSSSRSPPKRSRRTAVAVAAKAAKPARSQSVSVKAESAPKRKKPQSPNVGLRASPSPPPKRSGRVARATTGKVATKPARGRAVSSKRQAPQENVAVARKTRGRTVVTENVASPVKRGAGRVKKVNFDIEEDEDEAEPQNNLPPKGVASTTRKRGNAKVSTGTGQKAKPVAKKTENKPASRAASATSTRTTRRGGVIAEKSEEKQPAIKSARGKKEVVAATVAPPSRAKRAAATASPPVATNASRNTRKRKTEDTDHGTQIAAQAKKSGATVPVKAAGYQPDRQTTRKKKGTNQIKSTASNAETEGNNVKHKPASTRARATRSAKSSGSQKPAPPAKSRGIKAKDGSTPKPSAGMGTRRTTRAR